ncbi:hypothetical protein [Stigmatella hybrida]|uniref:hypothetical protein n=1 Tax=Stigmatella hybrida TaxID=394097 RepID=UPI001CDA5CD3|nr:hypothetical protein [Stigmatella hybrida]
MNMPWKWCAAAALLAFAPPSSAQTPPQYTIDLNSITLPSLPGLHSLVHAQGSPAASSRWLLIGGRTNGLHAFTQSSDGGTVPPPNAFPPSQANRTLWVVDPVMKQVWQAPLPSTPAIADALGTTNASAVQDGNTLYVIGGYGLNSATQQMTTFPALTSIQVDQTINAIVAGQPFTQYLQQTSTYYDCPAAGMAAYTPCFNTASSKCKPGPGWAACQQQAQTDCLRVQKKATAACGQAVQKGAVKGLPTDTGYYAKVAGGGMQKVGNVFWLVFGQDFEGLYSVNEGDYGKWPVSQVYTERFTAMWFGMLQNKLTAAVLNVIPSDPNSNQFHRRDLNVLSVLDSDGTTPLVAAYGGVFVPGENTGYQQPIYLKGGANPMTATPVLDPYAQMMSQYECATLRMFDANAKAMTTAFFGGISLYYLNPQTKKLSLDSGLPFINTLSVLTRNADGSHTEFVRSAPMAGYLGSNALFVPNPTVARTSGGIIALNPLTQKTLAGWFYGGIQANAPQNGTSTASSAVYEVWLTPGSPPANYWLPAVPPSLTSIKQVRE